MENERQHLEKMVNERQALDEKVDELVKTLDRLEDEWIEYERRISLMMVCKLTDPRHPFTDWELTFLHTENEQRRFRAVMTALQNRLEGNETPAVDQMKFDAIPKDVLYAASKPSRTEVVDILKQMGRLDDAGLVEVMNAVKTEIDVDSEFGVLADFVLGGVHFNAGPT